MTAASGRPVVEMHRVYGVVNRSLTIWGIDRRIWLFAAMVAATTFNMTTSLLAGIGVFIVVYATVRITTVRDPQLLTIIARSTNASRRYDPAKYRPLSLQVIRPCDIPRG